MGIKEYETEMEAMQEEQRLRELIDVAEERVANAHDELMDAEERAAIAHDELMDAEEALKELNDQLEALGV